MIRQYQVDSIHSHIGFSVKHLGVSTVRGRFTEFEGFVTADLDNPVDVLARGTVQAASISTGVAMRDDHLRSADFLAVETHPTISFELQGLERTSGNRYRIGGCLRIRDTSHQVEFDAALEGREPDPLGGDERVGLAVTGMIDRIDFGVDWNGLAGTVPVVGRKVKLQLDLALVAHAPETAQAGRAAESHRRVGVEQPADRR